MRLNTDSLTAIRLAQRTDKTAWIPTLCLSDAELVRRGFNLPGPALDLSGLSQAKKRRLTHFLHLPSADIEKDPKLSAEFCELIASCPRFTYLPPIDFDVSKEAGGTRELAIEAARRITPHLQRFGLGVPSWHTSGGLRGVHGDLLAPTGFKDVNLFRVAGELVRKAARAAGIPLISEHRAKSGRPPVVIDDKLFDKYPGARNGVWRGTGALRPDTKLRKTPIDILTGLPVPYVAPTPGDFDKFAEVAATLDAMEARQRSHRVVRAVLPRAEVPPGTTVLLNVARVYKEHAVTGTRHPLLIALAGWLLTSGFPRDLVQSTLEHAAGDGELQNYAKRATFWTEARIREALPVVGRNRIVKELGGESVAKAFEEAIRLDRCNPARRIGWEQEDRDYLLWHGERLPEGHPARQQLLDAAMCGGLLGWMEECPEHGLAGVRYHVEEREVTCIHCRDVRTGLRAKLLMEHWEFKRCGVAFIDVPMDGEDPINDLRRARVKFLNCFPSNTAWRWVLAYGYVVVFFDEQDLNVAKNYYKKNGLPNQARVVTKEEAVRIMADARRSPGLIFEQLVRKRDPNPENFPFLKATHVQRTNANAAGKETFYWESEKSLRLRAKKAAEEKRGGVPVTQCCVVVGKDEHGQVKHCRKHYDATLFHVASGKILAGPFNYEFPESMPPKKYLYTLFTSARTTLAEDYVPSVPEAALRRLL